MDNQSPTMDTSAVIDMEVMDGDESDYETNFADQSVPSGGDGDIADGQQSPPMSDKDKGFMDDMKQNMAKNVGSYVWQSGTQKARQVLNVYGNIDILRPYFDVEPHTVRKRLVQSLIPRMPSAQQRQAVPRELYGPTMLVFTMIALLLFQMKTSGHTVEEGTLMGTAFAVCFGYWLGVSGFVWFLAYVCNTHITMLQILSLIGYALFGHCIVVGLTTVIHTSHDHIFFYIIWAIFGGLSTLKMVSTFTSRTAGQTQKLIVCGAVALLHLCFLLYLHFAYHQIVEELSQMLESPAGAALPHEKHHMVERSVKDLARDNMAKMPEVMTKAVQKIVRNDMPAIANDTLKGAAPVHKLNDTLQMAAQSFQKVLPEGLKALNNTVAKSPMLKALSGKAVNGTI